MAIFSRVYHHGPWVDSRPSRQATSVVASSLEVVREEGTDLERAVFGVTTRQTTGTRHFDVRTTIIRHSPLSPHDRGKSYFSFDRLLGTRHLRCSSTYRVRGGDILGKEIHPFCLYCVR